VSFILEEKPMSDIQTILVVGAAGDLGHRIVDALIRAKARVRVGVRGGSTGKHGEQLRRWAEAGVEVADIDLESQQSLERACSGVHTVISALQGGPETIVDGQLRLLTAAAKAGVSRFMPSDFAEDFFTIAAGINPYLDARRNFADRAREGGVALIHLLNGGFMDAIFSSPGLVDTEAGTLTYWGEGDIPLDFTAMDDVAAYVVSVVSDGNSAGGVVAFAGDRRTIGEIAADYEAATGKALRLVRRGSIAEGYAELTRMQEVGAHPMAMLPLQYLLPMMSGEGRLKDVANGRYPAVEPTSLRAFLKR
jgi:uncharacterized protein YbjT (DUF2867 family)